MLLSYWFSFSSFYFILLAILMNWIYIASPLFKILSPNTGHVEVGLLEEIRLHPNEWD